jgi:AraC-like DNA-binding protein
MSESLAIEPILLDYAEQRGRIYEWRIGNGEYRSTKGNAPLSIGALRPGRHTLQIRLLGHEETASQYTLQIIPSGTFWLEIALAVAIICIGIISYKYRRRKEQLGKLLRQKHQLELRIAAEQAVEAHKQEEHRRITAQEEERRQALQERTQRSSELHRTLEQQIRTYLTETKAYRNPSLKVADVATAVGTSTTNVSEMCSMHLEVSFFSLINGYRFDEFKRIVRDEQYANYTITALAEMCGFKKSSFFNVFKEHEGCTPAAWLKREGIKRE